MERVRFLILWLAVMVVPTQNLYPNHERTNTIRSNQFTLFEENGKVGLKDEKGEVLIPALYEAIGWSDGGLSFVDKTVGYLKNGLWGLIHTSNKIITPPEYLQLRPGEGSFLIGQKKSPLSQRRSFGLINSAGKVLIPFQYDGLTLDNLRAIVVSRTGTRFLTGLTDLSHNMLIPLQYQRIYSLGSLRFAVENFEGKTAVFSDDGKQLSPFNIDSISAFTKDHAIIYQTPRQGLINRNGQFVLEPRYRSIQFKSDGKIRVKETDSWYILTGDNHIIGQHRADRITPLSSDRYRITEGGRSRLANVRLEPLHAQYYSSMGDLHGGCLLFGNEGKTGAMDSDGKVIVPARYQNLVADTNVFLASVDTGYKNRWTILDRSGQQITDRLYEEIKPFNGKFFPVRDHGFWGAVDGAGRETISCVHDSLLQYNGQYVVVKFKGLYGVVDLKENWVVTPGPNPINLLNGNFYLEVSESTTFLKVMPGEIIYFSAHPLSYDGQVLRELLPSGAHWIIDMNGVVVGRWSQPDAVEAVFQESEGLRAIRKDGKFGFIDAAGRLLIANRYEAAKPFSNGMAAIRIRDKWGFIDIREKLVVQPVYDEVQNYARGHAIVRSDNLSGLIDLQGRIVLPLRYDEITENEHARFLLRQGKLHGLADRAGTVVIHPRYERLTDTGNGYVIAERGGKAGLLTLNGVSTIPMVYDELIFDSHRNQYMGLKKSPWKDFEPSAQGAP